MMLFALGVLVGALIGTLSTCVIILLAWHFGWTLGEDDDLEVVRT